MNSINPGEDTVEDATKDQSPEVNADARLKFAEEIWEKE